MSFWKSCVLIIAVCLFPAFAFSAGQQTIQIGIDRDDNLETGCSFDPGTGNIRQGIDVVLEITVNADIEPLVVQSVRALSCVGGSFGVPLTLGDGWLVGINNGLQGGDVIEAAMPLSLLGQTQTVYIEAGIADGLGSDQVGTVLTFSEPVPSLHGWGMLVLMTLLLVAGVLLIRRRKKTSLMVLACLVLAGFSGAGFILDGEVDDWTDIPSIVIDDENESGTTEATDLIGVWACPSGNSLVFRVDVSDLQNDPPTAVDDQANTAEDQSVIIDVLANDTDPDMDILEVLSVTAPNLGSATVLDDGTIEYIPDPDNKGQDSFGYTITDSGGLTDSATVTIHIGAGNDDPTATDDAFAVDEDSSANSLDVLANDTTAPDTGETLSIISTSMPDNGGSVVINAGTSINYEPAADFFGIETFTYTVSDGNGGEDSATVRITVNNLNDDPDAVDDVLTVAEDSVDNLIDVLANDRIAPDSDETLTIVSIGTPDQGGSASISGNGVLYSPSADFVGTETFSYAISDGNGGNDTAMVTITVSNLNDAPVAVDDAATVDEDSTDNLIDVLANDTDIDGGKKLSITDVGVPSQGGSVMIMAGNLVYSPATDFFGTEIFAYTIEDLSGERSSATVTVTVNNRNDDPTAAADTAMVNEDSTANILNVLINDSVLPDVGETLTITAVGIPDQGGSVMISGGTSLSYSPAADFFGTETFTYTISDGNGGVDMSVVTVTVDNLNDDPTALADTATVTEDSTANTLDVLINDGIAPDLGETLTITAVGVPDQGGAVMINGGASLSYTPTADFFGTETFTYTISDGNGGSDTATVTVTVTGTNDPVMAMDDSFNAAEDGLTDSGDVLSNDLAPDGGLAVQSVDATSVTGATITDNLDGTFGYDPGSLFQALDDTETDTDSFDYVAEDDDGDTNAATVTVTIEGANDAPTADAVAETVDQNDTVVITLTGADVDVENLTFSIVSGPSNGSLGTVGSTGATTAQVIYTHNGLDTTPDSFTYVANDGTVDSPAATVSLTINPNAAPVANDDGSLLSPITVQKNSFLDILVTTNDTDSDGTIDPTTVNPGDGALGTTSALGGGTVRYTANMDAIGADTFTYTVDDDDGATSNSASVFVFINDPPVADDDMVALSEGSTTTISVLTGDTDSDGAIDPASVSITTDVPMGEGTTMVNADGTVFYDPGVFTGTTSFQYRVTDNLGGVSDPATVSINVSPLPMAMDDSFAVYGHTTVSVPASLGLLANDTDDGTITADTGTFATDNGGSITINADGSFVYTTPGPGSMNAPSLGGGDTYTYGIEDDLMGRDTATITFTYEKIVWFVENTNASGTEDGSQADPFNVRTDAEAVAAVGHTFFIFAGDGSTNGLDTSLVLTSGQEIIGEAAGLSVDVDGMGPGAAIEIVAPGSRPRMTSFTGDVITLDDDNLIEGLRLEPQASAGILGIDPTMIPMRAARSGRVPSDVRRAETREPRAWTRVGGATTINDMIIDVQNDFSDGLVFLGQTGTLTISNVTINGPSMGLTGQGGLIFDTCLVDADISNLAVNDIFSSVFLGGNFGSTFDFNEIDIASRDGSGLIATTGGTVTLTGVNNAVSVTGGEGFVLDGVDIGAAGVTLQSLSAMTCTSGLVISTVSGGDFTMTENLLVSDMVLDGVLLYDTDINATFQGLVEVMMVGDDGVNLDMATGSVTFERPLIIDDIGDDGIDIRGAEGTILFESTVTISNAFDDGIELNGENGGTPMGSTTFMSTVDIDNADFGLYIFDIHHDISFATVDIDTVGSGGAVFDTADIQGMATFTQLDVNAGAGTIVGLGIDNSSGTIDIDGGTIENVADEAIGILGSSVHFNFAGTATQATPLVELLLIDFDDTSTVVFEAGSMLTATAGEGLQLLDADGDYTFAGSVSVTGNDNDGMAIEIDSTGSFSFTGPATFSTATAPAVFFQGALGSTLDFSGGLDIDTTTGFGLRGMGSGTLTASGTNTIDTGSGIPIDLGSLTIGATGVNIQSVNSTGGTIFLDDTGTTGSLNITGIGTTGGSGGTLNGGANAIYVGGDARFSFANMIIENFTNSGILVEAVDNESVRGGITNVDLSTASVGAPGIALDGSGTGAMSHEILVSVADSDIAVSAEGILAESLMSTNAAAITSLTLTNTSVSSTDRSAVRAVADGNASLCLNATGNSPMVSADDDFTLAQADTATLSISQASVAALGAANDGGTASTASTGTITPNGVCQTP